jgi:hypothetical protein
MLDSLRPANNRARVGAARVLPGRNDCPKLHACVPNPFAWRRFNWQVAKLAGFEMVISELEVERDLLRRAARDLEE